MKNIGIFGAGAMGSLFAYSTTNHFIHILTRTSKQAHIINTHGLLYRENHILKKKLNIKAYTDISSMPKLDLGVLAVKQYDVDSILNPALKCLKNNGNLLCLQNGIRKYQNRDKIIQGVWYSAAYLDENYILVPTANGTLYLERDIPIINIPKNYVDFYYQQKKKLVINSVINPLTALLGIKNGDLLHYPDLIKIMLDEANFALSMEIKLSEVITVLQNTSQNKSSMLQDIIKNNPTELEWITAPIIENSETNMHRLIYNLLAKSDKIFHTNI